MTPASDTIGLDRAGSGWTWLDLGEPGWGPVATALATGRSGFAVGLVPPWQTFPRLACPYATARLTSSGLLYSRSGMSRRVASASSSA